MIAELLIVIWFSVLGACVVSLCGPPALLRRPFMLLAPLVGIVTSGLLGSAVAAFEVQRLPRVIVAGGVLICAGAAWRAYRARQLLTLAASMSAVCGLSAAGVSLVYVSMRPTLTSDSYMLVMLGSAARSGRLETKSSAVADYPFMVVHVQALARDLGAEYSLYAAGVTACLGIVGALGIAARCSSESRRIRVFGGLALATAAATSYVLRVQLSYLNSHLLAAALLAAIVAMIAWCGSNGADHGSIGMIGLFLAGYTIVRVEGLMIVTMLLVVLIHTVSITTAHAIRLGSIALIVPSVWYAALVVGGASGDILGPVELAVLLVAPWIVLAVGRASGAGRLGPLVDPRLMMATFGIAVVGLSFLRRPEVPKSLATMIQNTLITGGWGPFWWLATALAVASAVPAAWPQRARTERTDAPAGVSPWTGAIGSYLLVVAVLGAVRSLPYRSGWDDSGNRMLVHIAPTVVIALVLHAVRPARASAAATTRAVERPTGSALATRG